MMPELLTPWITGAVAIVAAAVVITRSHARERFGRWEPFDWTMALFFSSVLVVAAVVLSLAVASAIGSMLPTTMNEEPAYTRQLVSLRSNDGVTGRISGGLFITTGYVGTEQYYFYYEDSGSGRVTPRRLRVGNGDGIYIIEGIRESADVQKFDWHFLTAWWRRFFVEPELSTWYFHVPHGTVQRTMQLE